MGITCLSKLRLPKSWLAKYCSAALPIALLWLSIILYYTKGGLLVGGDWPGYYDAFSAVRTGIPLAIVYGLGLFLVSGNIYAGFYLGTFIGICLNLMSLTYFLRVLFPEWREKFLPQFIACSLYIFGFFSVYNTFKSVIGLADIAGGGLLLFLAQVVKFFRYTNTGHDFTTMDCVLMGIGVAVSSRVPPNSFRIILAELIIVASLLTLSFVKRAKVKNAKRNFLSKTSLILTTSIVGMLYWEIPFFSSFERNIEIASIVAKAQFTTATLQAPYANLINTFRVLGVWAFPTGYCPYHDLYFQNPLITVTSFLWPAMALGLSLLFANKHQRLKVLSLVAGSLLVIAWDMADNPPVGVLNKFIVSSLPQTLWFFPTFFLSGTFLPIFYITLLTFVIYRTLAMLQRSSMFNKMKQRALSIIVLSFMIMALLIPDAPFFTGQALGQYFDQSIKGIWVPQEYLTIRSLVSGSDGRILVLPSLTTYIQTSWGYQGGSNFYNEFFAPKDVITPQNPIFGAGGYTLYYPETRSPYILLTSPRLQPDESKMTPVNLDYDKITVWGAKYNRTAASLTFYGVEKADHIDVSIPFSHSYNAHPYQFFVLKMEIHPTEAASILINGLWIGIGSPNTVGWYIIGSSTNTYSVKDDQITIAMLIGFPDKPLQASTYDPGNVTGIVIRIYHTQFPSISLKIASLNLAKASISNPVIDLWKNYGVKYILIDKSIVAGSATDLSAYNYAIVELTRLGIIKPVYIGDLVELYSLTK